MWISLASKSSNAMDSHPVIIPTQSQRSTNAQFGISSTYQSLSGHATQPKYLMIITTASTNTTNTLNHMSHICFDSHSLFQSNLNTKRSSNRNNHKNNAFYDDSSASSSLSPNGRNHFISQQCPSQNKHVSTPVVGSIIFANKNKYRQHPFQIRKKSSLSNSYNSSMDTVSNDVYGHKLVHSAMTNYNLKVEKDQNENEPQQTIQLERDDTTGSYVKIKTEKQDSNSESEDRKEPNNMPPISTYTSANPAKPFKCKDCDRCFKRRSNLRIHEVCNE